MSKQMSQQESVEEEKREKEKEASKLIEEEKAEIGTVWWTYVIVFLSV